MRRHGRDPSEVGHVPRTRQASMPPVVRGRSEGRGEDARPRARPAAAHEHDVDVAPARERAHLAVGERRQRQAVDRAHDRVLPELVGERRRDVAAGHAEAEARLLLPEHGLAVVAERDRSGRSRPGGSTDRQRSPSKSAGRSSRVDPEASVQARRERERDQAEHDPARPPPRARNSATSTASASHTSTKARTGSAWLASGRPSTSVHGSCSQVRCPATTRREPSASTVATTIVIASTRASG